MRDPNAIFLNADALETIVDRLPLGAIILDDDGIVRRFNRHEEQLSGLKREDVLGKSFFSEIAPCTSTVELGARFREGLDEGNLNLDFEFSFPYPYNRVPRDVRIRAVSVQREPSGLHVVLIEDITSRRQLERNNEEMMQGLRSAIARARTDSSSAPELAPRELHAVALSTSLKGFADFAGQLPPNELFQVIDGVMERVVALIHARGGRVESLRGDGIDACFEVGEDTHRGWIDAAYAASEIIQKISAHPLAPPFSVGLAAGPLMTGPFGRREFKQRTTIGPAMEIARALAQTARPEEVLVEASVQVHLEDIAQFDHLRGMSVPGVQQHGDIYQLGGLQLP